MLISSSSTEAILAAIFLETSKPCRRFQYKSFRSSYQIDRFAIKYRVDYSAVGFNEPAVSIMSGVGVPTAIVPQNIPIFSVLLLEHIPLSLALMEIVTLTNLDISGPHVWIHVYE